jgi:phenylalanine-4-hydroxylase
MKKHDINYHEYDDSISFYLDHCNHLEVFNHSYSNKLIQIQTKKEAFFSKRIISDQSKIIQNKETKTFLEKINNLKMILKKLVNLNERLIKLFKRLNERRINES